MDRIESQSSKITISFHACVLLPLVFLSSIPIVTTLLSYSIPAVSVKPFYYISIPIAVALTFGAWHLTKETFRDYTIALSTYELVALIAIMLICSLFILPTFYVGSATSAGGVYTIFTLDDPKHYAYIYELAHATYPPRNPFFASEPLHYYYFYYLLTAIFSIVTGINVYLAKALTHLLAINLFILAFVFFARKFLGTRQTIAASALLCFVGGLDWVGNAIYAQKAGFLANIGKQLLEGGSQNINNSSWIYDISYVQVKTDFFYRVFVYVPQHTLALAAMLCLFTVIMSFKSTKSEPRWTSILPLSLLIGGIFGGSIFIFMAASIVAAPYILYLSVKTRWRDAALISLPFIIGVALTFPMFIDTLHSAGKHKLLFDPAFGARAAGLATYIFMMFLEYGALIPFGILGAITMRKTEDKDKNALLLIFTLTPFIMAHLFRLNVQTNDFGMHLLRITWIGLAIYSVGFFKDGIKNRLTPLFIILCIGGAISVAEGVSVHRNSSITKETSAIYNFIKTDIPETSTIQSGPYNDAQYTPFISGRRVAVADDWNTLISADLKSVTETRTELDSALKSQDPQTAWQTMEKHKIDYLMLNYQDILRYGASLDKFRSKPFFEVIYDKNYVSIIKILPLEVYDFIKKTTPLDSIVQTAPYNPTLYTSFLTGRKVAFADNSPASASTDANDAGGVKTAIDMALKLSDPKIAWAALRRYKIDYLLLDYNDVLRYGRSLDKFQVNPFFEVIYNKDYTYVVKVLPL